MILCIDFKSFYVLVECVLRGFDLFKILLVVVDKFRGGGFIVFVVLFYLKFLGVLLCCRIFELFEDLNIIYVKF